MRHREPRKHDPKASRRAQAEAVKIPRAAQAEKWARVFFKNPEATVADLHGNDDAKAFVADKLLKTLDSFDLAEYDKQMIATEPVMAVPERDQPLQDLDHIVSQPEMREFWAAWTAPPPLHGGRRPNYPGVKMVAMVMAMTDEPRARYAISSLKDNLALRERFQQLHGSLITVPDPASVSRLLPRLALVGIEAAKEANVAVVRALEDMFPDLKGRPGHTYMIDGSDIPAWIQQKGRSSDPGGKLESKLRARIPEAGWRVYQRTPEGKVTPDGKVSPGTAITIKAWRGYYWITIINQALNVPVVSILISASEDEVASTRKLLMELHRLHPDARVHELVADAAWDEENMHRLLEVEFGGHLVARHKPSTIGIDLAEGDHRNGAIVHVGPQGRMRCKHQGPGEALTFATTQAPSRAGLKPGQSSSPGAFRVRAIGCPLDPEDPDYCGGKLGLQMQVSWRRLTYLPKYCDTGSSARYHRRIALLDRLGQMEGSHARLKTRNLGTAGAQRMRVRDTRSVEVLLQLAQLGLNTLTVADQRRHRDIDPAGERAYNSAGLMDPPASASVPDEDADLDFLLAV